MRVPRLAALLVLLIAPACGGRSTPTAPTSTTIPSVFDFASGSYTLTITMSQTGEPVCNGNICGSISLCGGAGAPGVGSLSTAVRVDRNGAAVTIRPDDPAATLRMDLNLMGGAGVSGSISGQFRSGTIEAFVSSGDGRTPAVASGARLASSVTGKIDGSVGIGGYYCSNNGHSWALVPR